jgi:hypothetical protein
MEMRGFLGAGIVHNRGARRFMEFKRMRCSFCTRAFKIARAFLRGFGLSRKEKM